MVDSKSLKEHVVNKEVATVWVIAWLYPWYRPLFTQTGSQSVNLVFEYLLSPLEFLVYYLPMTLGGGMIFVVYHLAFAVIVVFLLKFAIGRFTNRSRTEE